MKPHEIDRLALTSLRQAQSMGWHPRGMACDYAVGVLKANGVSHDAAHKAVASAWAQHFEISGPV